MLAIPVDNAFVERVVSLVNNLCLDNRNRMSMSLVEAESFVLVNFDRSCAKCHQFLCRDELNST